MSDYSEKYTKELEEIWVEVDQELLENIIKPLRWILWNRDSALVSVSDPAELEIVKKNFVEKKLDVHGEEADAAVKKVAEHMKADRTKSRVVFYYLLCKELGKSV